MALREAGGVGPKLFQAILNLFGSPENVYSVPIDQLSNLPRVSEERAVKMLSSQEVIPMMSERIERLAEEDIHIATFLDEGYPARLRRLDDPPPVLYYRGTLPDPFQKSISIVGTTEATSGGIAAAVDISSMVSRRGCSVVSGLARGIDTAAHIGALKNDGVTHAVIGSGLYNIYPEENSPIAEQLSRRGALVTEYPPDATVNTGRLIARNRLIVGFSDSTIVAELSPDSSGTLSAAEACDRQGKLLFYLQKGDEEKRGINVPRNAIPFESLDAIETILENSIGS
jgi:DNA processing protein